MKRLDIDPTRVEMGWIMDFCAQSLRNIIIGIGGRTDGFMMQSKFGIAVGSECMAILSIAKDLADLKDRLNKITVAFDKSGKPGHHRRSRGRQRHGRFHAQHHQPHAHVHG